MDRLGELTVQSRLHGRALHVERDGTVFLGRGLEILRSEGPGGGWRPVARISSPRWRRALARSRLAARLMRHEIRALAPLANGGLVAAARAGVFWTGPGRGEGAAPVQMEASRVEAEAGAGYAPPRCFARGPREDLLFGEYFSNRERRGVGIFASEDGGRSFHLVHRFAPGCIRHVHGIWYDPGEHGYWLFAGDHQSEPGIGRLAQDGSRFEWLVKGEQAHRACVAFDLGDRLVYGTDSEKARNAVISLVKATGRIERLQELEGSCLHACRFGGWYALSTTVEPSRVNRSASAELWVSRDGASWSRVLAVPKDRWNATYFQFGSIVLPSGESDQESFVLSGQAVERLDGLTIIGALATAPGEPRPDTREER